MCYNTSKIEANIKNMDAVAAGMAEIQQNVNAPLFDILFKLADHPQTSSLNSKKVKVLHEYAHNLLDFYMTECPDTTSIRVINTTAVHDIATKLRTLGDGLTRLLRYLGMNDDARTIDNLINKLAKAYDEFGAATAKAQRAIDEFDDCDCEDETSWVDEHCEDDDAEEFDPEDESGAEAEEQARKLFEKIFGFNPDVLKRPEEKPQPKTEPNQREKVSDETDKLLNYLFGCKPEEPKAKPEKTATSSIEDELLARLFAPMLASEMVKPRRPSIFAHEVHPGFWSVF